MRHIIIGYFVIIGLIALGCVAYQYSTFTGFTSWDYYFMGIKLGENSISAWFIISLLLIFLSIIFAKIITVFKFGA